MLRDGGCTAFGTYPDHAISAPESGVDDPHLIRRMLGPRPPMEMQTMSTPRPFERLGDRTGKMAARRPRRAARRGCRPWDIQPLEERQLLSSTYTVISTADDGSDGTLRWAIGQVNSDPGPDADTIDFAI